MPSKAPQPPRDAFTTEATLRALQDISVATTSAHDPVTVAELAVERARTLTGAGVPVGRIVAAGFGAEHPRVANTDDAARSKNRRIEVLLVPIRSVASR